MNSSVYFNCNTLNHYKGCSVIEPLVPGPWSTKTCLQGVDNEMVTYGLHSANTIAQRLAVGQIGFQKPYCQIVIIDTLTIFYLSSSLRLQLQSLVMQECCGYCEEVPRPSWLPNIWTACNIQLYSTCLKIG